MLGRVNLYTDALNLEYPWFVMDLQFDKINGRLDIYLTVIVEYAAYLHAPLPRVTCGYYGKVKAAHIPWARPSKGLTEKFELLMLELIKCMPVLNVAKQVRLHDTRIWRVVHDYVNKALEKMDFKIATVYMIEGNCNCQNKYKKIAIGMEPQTLASSNAIPSSKNLFCQG